MRACGPEVNKNKTKKTVFLQTTHLARDAADEVAGAEPEELESRSA